MFFAPHPPSKQAHERADQEHKKTQKSQQNQKILFTKSIFRGGPTRRRWPKVSFGNLFRGGLTRRRWPKVSFDFRNKFVCFLCFFFTPETFERTTDDGCPLRTRAQNPKYVPFCVRQTPRPTTLPQALHCVRQTPRTHDPPPGRVGEGLGVVLGFQWWLDWAHTV